MIDNLTILNVLDTDPVDMSIWIAQNVLNFQLPEKFQFDVEVDLLPLLPVITNKSILMTSLYGRCLSAKPGSTKVSTDMKTSTPHLTAKIDMLYRTIQTLESARETVVSIKSSIQAKAYASL